MPHLAIGLLVLALSKTIFEWMNLTNMGQKTTKALALRSTKLVPLALVGFIGFSTGLKWSYDAIGNNIWLLLIIEECVNYVVKIGMRGAMFKQPIGPGAIAGLALSIVAAIVAGVWK